MDILQKIQAQVVENNKKIDRDQVKNILIIYEEQDFFIGDSCIMFDKFKACKLFFKHAAVDINFAVEAYVDSYRALLKANPNIDHISDQRWEDIDYMHYDLVFCITPREEMLLQVISGKYADDQPFTTAVFSFSRQIIDRLEDTKTFFPVYEAFYDFSRGDLGPMELYVDEEDRIWADTWLNAKGLKENEKLLIILDSTSVKTKLLKMTVYYELLMYFLGLPDARILIFDEKNIGKEQFYKELLGANLSQKFIFSNGLDLRKAIALLSSEKARLIFGPCTGLMHCASGIYNNFLKNGLDHRRIPLLITYTGKYHKQNENANYWWHNAPLMNCMIIRQKNGLKEMVLLHELGEKEKLATDNTLECADYTPGMMLNFLTKNLKLHDE